MSVINFGQHFNPANNPKLVILNTIQLPWNTAISIDDEKTIVESQIIDGVTVFERINKKAAEINIECTAVELNSMLKPTFIQKYLTNGRVSLGDQQSQGNYISLNDQLTNPPFLEFPQEQLKNMYQSIFSPNQVVPIVSTQLNDIGITQLVVKKISIMPKLGSKQVSVRFNCLENYVGTNSLGTSLFVQV